MNTDDDAVLHKGYVRRFGVDIAGGVGVATDVVAPLRTIEELRLERAFEGLGRYFDLNCIGFTTGREQKGNRKEQADGRSVHMLLSIKAAGDFSLPRNLSFMAATL